MKAWVVGTRDVGYLACRAETRGKARAFFSWRRDDFAVMRVLRWRAMDGGEAGEIDYAGTCCCGTHYAPGDPRIVADYEEDGVRCAACVKED